MNNFRTILTPFTDDCIARGNTEYPCLTAIVIATHVIVVKY